MDVLFKFKLFYLKSLDDVGMERKFRVNSRRVWFDGSTSVRSRLGLEVNRGSKCWVWI